MQTEAVLKITDDLKWFLNHPVGFIRINESFVHHNSNFECAAWWEDSRIETGVYPLILNERSQVPNNLNLIAKLKAKVVDDYFPSLWGGLPIGSKPYQPTRLGQERIITYNYDIVEAINNTGYSPGSKIDFCVNPLLWKAFEVSARKSLECYKMSLDNWWNSYQENGDGEYGENVSMIGHCTGNIKSLTVAIKTIGDKLRQVEGQSDYMKGLYVKNISWVTESNA